MKAQNLPVGRIFVCINEKEAGKSQCDHHEGKNCLDWLKDQIKDRGLKGQVRVTGTRCLGYCENKGTAVVFEPMHEQYSNVVTKDLPPLLEKFLDQLKLK